MLLARLLDSLEKQTFKGPEPRVSLVVVDSGTEVASEVASAFARRSRWEVRYLCQAESNIAVSRNRTVDAALTEGAKRCAFIDDDEWAEPTWLDELIQASFRYQASVVAGTVVPKYGAGVAGWIREGDLYDFPDLPSGTPVTSAFTGNCLVDAGLLQTGLRFDERFGRSGGEDTHFFMRARRDGARMVWTAEAKVYEQIPVDRTRIPTMLARAYRIGVNTVRCERSVLPAGEWLLARVSRAAGSVVLGVLLVAPRLLMGRASAFRSVRSIAHGLGCFAGLLGVRVKAY